MPWQSKIEFYFHVLMPNCRGFELGMNKNVFELAKLQVD